MDEVLQSLLILEKYDRVDDRVRFSAQHDQIWVGVYWGELIEEDKKELEKLGWFEDGDQQYCTKFV